MYSIYKVTNLINNKCYIGITKRKLSQRWTEHCKPSRNKVSALTSSICKYGKENFKIELIYKTNNYKFMETYFIHLYNTLSPNGYNLTTGGEHPVFTDEELLKRKERRKKQAAPIPKGYKQSKDWAFKRIKNRRKAVIGTKVDSNEILQFESISDACRYFKTSASLISKICIAKKGTAYGYYWRFKD